VNVLVESWLKADEEISKATTRLKHIFKVFIFYLRIMVNNFARVIPGAFALISWDSWT
jgi:hypothetical protein